MADTAHKTDEEKKEYFDPPEVLNLKVKKLADWITESDHFIAFTGAGISTAAGIPDFRSGIDTILPTGPGAWEKLAVKKNIKKPDHKILSLKAIPTKTHMSLVKLAEAGILKYLISQNTDGLHRKSGIPPEKLAELHGCTNLEKCQKCGKVYMRDFKTRTSREVHKHETGRFCDSSKCKGRLFDSIINFGENLPEQEINNGFEEANKADLCLVMGSSLRVTPAATMPKNTAKRGGKLVIVNLQKTPLDDMAALRINAKCDDVMVLLMKKLEMDIPEFRLTRRVKFSMKEESKSEKNGLCISGIDPMGAPYSLFSKVDILLPSKSNKTLNKEPFIYKPEIPFLTSLTVRLYFQGHYNEPFLDIDLKLSGLKQKKFMIVYNPFSFVWESCTEIE